jgi:hypothetical protein
LTALDWAALGDHPRVVKMPAAHGAELNPVDRFGYTPLMYAARGFWRRGHRKVLLAAGTVRVKNKDGKTAAAPAQDYPQIGTALGQT